MRMRVAALTLTLGLAACGLVKAQAPLEVGTRAPDFTLPAATADGVVKPVHLADLRGRTVVLAFFYKARTGG
jgi:cytochrome oxidase Cu insertion factor (SCO1/SenC/PrrC family)